MDTLSEPSERRLRADLSGADFEAGLIAGHWKFVSLDWPNLKVTVSPRHGPDLAMKILVDNYPVLAPYGQPWDLETDLPLPVERWPIGGALFQVFSPTWSPSNGNAPYLACDRIALSSHTPWTTEHPARAWNSDRTIAFYLQEIYRELRAAVARVGQS